jgi:hypothetical protein
MKSTYSSTLTCLRRFCALVGVALLLGLTGCSMPDFASGKALRSLEEEVTRIQTVQQLVERRLGLWQVAAAVFLVLAGFALVGGAALGSRARRLRDRHRKPQADAQAHTQSQP